MAFQDSVQAGSQKTFVVVVRDAAGVVIPPDLYTVQWAVESGAGTVDGNGVFTAPAAIETDKLTATVGGIVAEADLSIVAGPPASVEIEEASEPPVPAASAGEAPAPVTAPEAAVEAQGST